MPFVKDDYSVSVYALLHVMGNEDYSHANFMVESMTKPQHHPSSIWIKHGGGFVKHHALWLHCKNACNGYKLFLTSRKHVRTAMTKSRQPRQGKAHFKTALHFIHAQPHVLKAKRYVILNGV